MVNFLLRSEFSTGGESDYFGGKRPIIQDWSVAKAAGRSSASGSCGCGQQVAHSHQIVSGQRKGEHPAHSRQAAMASLAQPTHGLEPAEDLLHPFAFLLTNRVARLAGGAVVDSAALLAR